MYGENQYSQEDFLLAISPFHQLVERLEVLERETRCRKQNLINVRKQNVLASSLMI